MVDSIGGWTQSCLSFSLSPLVFSSPPHTLSISELSKTFTTSTETIQRYLKKVLRQLTKAADSTSDSGVHSGSEIDSVCGGEEKTRGDKEKDKHDCVQPPILSTIFQSAAERGVTGEETMLIRGLHMYSNGEILKAKEEEEESDDEQCADEKVSTEIHYPAVSSHPACNFNYYEAVHMQASYQHSLLSSDSSFSS